MIRHINGDLLSFPEGCQVIAHCCNCKNTFGSGIAKSIRDSYPDAYKADTAIYRMYPNKKDLLGRITVAKVGKGRFVANLYAQESYGGPPTKYVNYEAIHECFLQLRTWCRENRKDIIGLPYNIACCRAGGNWNIIMAMIEDVFNEGDLQCMIVKL